MIDDDALRPACELTHLLRTGPFAAALRAAIEDRGLTLDRIQRRLEHLGTPVSTATLSCWRSGRYQPSHASALAALGSLEQVLGVPAGALHTLLDPPKPRARRLWACADQPTALWPQAQRDGLDRAYRAVDTRWVSSLRCLSRHTRLELDADRRDHRIWRRQLMRAEQDGPDRMIFVQVPDSPGSVPELTVRPPVRAGASFGDPATGLLVAELLFDEPLRRGGTAIVETTLTYGEPRPLSREFLVHHEAPAGECVLEVCFHPDALPAACHAFGAPVGPGPDARRLLHAAGGSVHVAGTLTAPGDFGIDWEWPA